MQPTHDSGGVARVGPFEVNLDEGVLRKNGVRIRLQAQPFQILAALLQKPGSVVTREELRTRLWPDDTFVDFEHGLNAAVTRLRQALGDSAEQPRYIETLPKRGYRLIQAVEPRIREPVEPAPPVPSPLRRRLTGWVAGALVLTAAAGGAAYVALNKAAPEWRPVPLTTFPGFESDPALSPDGNAVAFSWNGEKQDNFDIYVMPLRSGTPLRLTSNPVDDLNPVWSPDGRRLAFLRRLGSQRAELLTIPTSGGPEQKLGEIQNRSLAESPIWSSFVTWSPDSQWVAASHHEPGGMNGGIYLFSLTGEMRQLTSLPASYRGDEMPAFSPDGRTLAFCRLSGWSSSDIYVLPLKEGLRPAGEVHRLTTDDRWSASPAWSEDGRSITYVFGQDAGAARRELRMIDAADGHVPRRLAPLQDDVWTISAARGHMVYSRKLVDSNIWRVTLPTRDALPVKPERFISSTRMDGAPKYSPDGTKVAFASGRSGSGEIWIANADGSRPVRLTSFGGPLVGYMSWSPDGRWIAFHARPKGQADLFVIPAAGGEPRRLTNDPADDMVPEYSHDGRWIYFTSTRSGRNEIWRMPAAGGEATPITATGGSEAVESPDGHVIYYKYDGVESEIWKVPAEGGRAVRVVSPTHPWPFGLAVTKDGMYYGAAPHSGDQRYIRFFSFSTGNSRPVAVTNRPFVFGMTVSPDGRYLLYDQYDQLGSELMLIENFFPQ